jgi:hypothetical protein
VSAALRLAVSRPINVNAASQIATKVIRVTTSVAASID